MCADESRHDTYDDGGVGELRKDEFDLRGRMPPLSLLGTDSIPSAVTVDEDAVEVLRLREVKESGIDRDKLVIDPGSDMRFLLLVSSTDLRLPDAK